jgi:predicted transcriptional regulator
VPPGKAENQRSCRRRFFFPRRSNALKKARKENGITQAQLAEALGKPQANVGWM